MVRSQALLGVALGLLGSAAAMAADYPDTMRGSFPSDWSNQEMDDPLSFEAGLRYFYSRGEQTHTVGGNTYSSTDEAHILEGHFRIDDHLSDSFLKGVAGISVQASGTTTTPSGAGVIQSGQIGYVGADFGYLPLKMGLLQAGGFVGYQFSAESMDITNVAYAGASGVGTTDNVLETHAFKVGVAAKAEFNDLIDVTAEAAFIPYAYMSGSYLQGSNGTIAGNLYGASAEVMVGVHPAENAIVRVGGRASYMEGQTKVDGTTNSDKYSALRYGLLAELTYKF